MYNEQPLSQPVVATDKEGNEALYHSIGAFARAIGVKASHARSALYRSCRIHGYSLRRVTINK